MPLVCVSMEDGWGDPERKEESCADCGLIYCTKILGLVLFAYQIALYDRPLVKNMNLGCFYTMQPGFYTMQPGAAIADIKSRVSRSGRQSTEYVQI